MPARLPKSVVSALAAAKIMGIRAGGDSKHRFVGVWPIVVDGRVFARSWTSERDGWYRTFLADPRGTLQVGAREIRVRARAVKGERLRDKIEDAYAAKFNTKASMKYVRGFRTKRRRDTTTEFVPR